MRKRKTMANTNAVKFGLSKAYYAVYNEAEGTYGTPVPLPGAVSMTISREGDESSFFADNVVFYSMDVNAGYSGDLEVAMMPEQAYIDLLGQERDANGILVESTDDKQKTFALLYEVEGNAFDQRFAFYNCTLSRPESEANTKEETVDPDTDTMAIRMISRALPWGDDTKNTVKASCKSTTNAEQYEDWYKAVYLPSKPSA